MKIKRLIVAFYRNSGPGIMIYSSDKDDDPLTGTKIVNNIIVANGRNIHLPKNAGYAFIIADNCKQGFQSDCNLLDFSTSNLVRWGTEEFGTLSSWQGAQGQDMHSIEVEPPNVNDKEFYLNPPAQAIDRGMLVDGLTNDILGNKRPCGKGIDRGRILKYLGYFVYFKYLSSRHNTKIPRFFLI